MWWKCHSWKESENREKSYHIFLYFGRNLLDSHNRFDWNKWVKNRRNLLLERKGNYFWGWKNFFSHLHRNIQKLSKTKWWFRKDYFWRLFQWIQEIAFSAWKQRFSQKIYPQIWINKHFAFLQRNIYCW
jgi:hypothetical protein